MSKKIVLSILLLSSTLLAVSGCGGAIVEVGVESSPEEKNDGASLPAEPVEDQTAGLLPAAEENAEEAPATAETDFPVDGVVLNEDGSSTYTNTEYGFRFSFPAGWSLAETPAQDMPDEGGPDQGPSIQLTKSDILLFIGYRHAGEQVIWWTGVGAFGGEISRDALTFLGQDVIQVAHGYDTQVKFVAFESADSWTISADDLEFGIRMDDISQVPFEELEIPPEIVAEAGGILSSFELLP